VFEKASTVELTPDESLTLVRVEYRQNPFGVRPRARLVWRFCFATRPRTVEVAAFDAAGTPWADQHDALLTAAERAMAGDDEPALSEG
jgi:hypothetical protein